MCSAVGSTGSPVRSGADGARSLAVRASFRFVTDAPGWHSWTRGQLLKHLVRRE